MTSAPTGFYYTYVFSNAVCAFLDSNPYEIYAFATDVCLKSSASTSTYLSYTTSGKDASLLLPVLVAFLLFDIRLGVPGPSILKISYSSPNCDPTLGSTNATIPLVCQGGYEESSYYRGYSAGSDINTIIPQNGLPYAVAT